MHLDFLYEVFEEAREREALIHDDRATTYGQLLELCRHWRNRLDADQIAPGTVVALRADYSPDSIALLLELAQRNAIVLQAGLAVDPKLADILRIGEAEAVITIDAEARISCEKTGARAANALYGTLRQHEHPGMVLFSSGSTGAIKGTVHDLSLFLKKYRVRRHDLRTITFLLFDHVGGVDTLFYCLSNGSCIIAIERRDPATVCAAVARYRAEVLPVAPTFLTLLYFSGEYARHDLSSLKYVTYGAEMMPEQTLRFCREMFPGATLVQKYGTSEVGTPRSQSKSPDSLWMKLGGEGFAWRVVDGILQIKAEGAMLGYLNAPSPFTADGWFITGDCVEVDGEYLRILGRDSDLINVGGKKVYPAEVEAAIQELPEVIEAIVYGERNALTGQIVAARVWARPETDETALRRRIRQHAASRLEAFKVPVRVTFASGEDFATDRFKKLRREAKGN
jgi:acyl-coenzyme A synthetase/AMP-(fatty) acid ligase